MVRVRCANHVEGKKGLSSKGMSVKEVKVSLVRDLLRLTNRSGFIVSDIQCPASTHRLLVQSQKGGREAYSEIDCVL